jgi:histidinol phosphatase-like PHP family hydrolase
MFFDFHIHTKYSSCCKEDYVLTDAYKKAKERGYEGIGVSDHCNFKSYSAPSKFLMTQKNAITSNNLTDQLLLGLEITIVDRKGNLGVNPKYLKMLDYYIISEHVHIAKLFSEYYNMKQKFRTIITSGTKPYLIPTYIQSVQELVVNGIKKNPHSINAHIWRFPRNVGYYSTELLDKTDLILEQLQNSAVAFELHNSFFSYFQLTQEESNTIHTKNLSSIHKSFHETLVDPKRFVQELLKKASKYDIFYSLGSDAHKINDIGRFGSMQSADKLIECLKSMNIPLKKIITPEFFKNRENIKK